MSYTKFRTKLEPEEKRLIRLMFILAVTGILASVILPFVWGK